jgi:hypothetical protein
MGESAEVTRKLGAVVCATALLATVALADATTKTKSGIVNAGTSRSLTAKCPKGERVDVGGFRSTVNGPSGILIEDLSFEGSRKWTARFDGLGDSAPAASIAYCAHGPKLTKRTGSDIAVAPRAGRSPRAGRWRARGMGGGILLTATAKCPRGETVQLGGFTVRDPALPPARGGVPSSFRPASMQATSPRKWRVRGVAESPGTRLTAVAGCADRPAPHAVKKTEPIEGGGAKSSTKAKCPRGERVAMGGFKQTLFDDGGPYVRGLKRPSPRTWKATTWEFENPGRLTAIAYCR